MSNNSFKPEELPQPTRDLERMRDQLDVYGYCIVDAALPEQTLSRLQSRIFEQAEMERKLHRHKNPANLDPVNQWVGMLLNKGEVFMELIEHELCMNLLEHMLGRDFLISCVDAQIQHPGSVNMPLHTDQWWMPQPIDPKNVRTRPAEYARGKTAR